MKNIYSLFILIVLFGTSLNAFNSSNASRAVQLDCTGLALDVFDTYYSNGYSYQESYQRMNWAYEGCVNNLGYAGEEVIIN